ncbi:MAG: acyl carrier protein [Candidatus Paceibacteria bacterium]|jgi:acyl carrier protein
MTETDQLRGAIKRLIVERLFIDGLDPKDIADDAPIGEEFGLDSMDFLELAVGLEQEFGLQIVGKGIDPDSLRSVDSLVVFVQQKLASKESGN